MDCKYCTMQTAKSSGVGVRNSGLSSKDIHLLGMSVVVGR